MQLFDTRYLLGKFGTFFKVSSTVSAGTGNFMQFLEMLPQLRVSCMVPGTWYAFLGTLSASVTYTGPTVVFSAGKGGVCLLLL